MKVSEFLFDSIYQIVTWVLIALSIGGIYHFSSRGNIRGVMWSIIALVVFVAIMIGIIGERYLPKPEDETPKVQRPSAYVTITDSKLERDITAGDYPTFYFTLNNGPVPVKGTMRNVSVYYCGIQDQVFPWGEGMTKRFTLMPNERTTVIFRFNNYILKTEWVSALTQEKARLLFYFRGEYTDDSGRTYPMKHCFIWNKYMGQNLALCGDDIKLE